MEGFPAKKVTTPEKAADYLQGQNIGDEFFRNEDIAVFEKYDRRFDGLPPDNRPMFKKEGDMVRFPNQEGKVVEWGVARAEKMHYVLEHRRQDERFDYAFCSEQELREKGQN